MSYEEEVLYATLLGYACNEVEKETFRFIEKWANSNKPKTRDTLLNYLYGLLKKGVIEAEQYCAVKELI